jgi:hypothetical protein
MRHSSFFPSHCGKQFARRGPLRSRGGDRSQRVEQVDPGLDFKGAEFKIAPSREAIFENSHPTHCEISPPHYLLIGTCLREHRIEDPPEEAPLERTVRRFDSMQDRLKPLTVLELKVHLVEGTESSRL